MPATSERYRSEGALKVEELYSYNIYNASDKRFDDMILHDDCYVILRE